jgi:hypothetical protein
MLELDHSTAVDPLNAELPTPKVARQFGRTFYGSPASGLLHIEEGHGTVGNLKRQEIRQTNRLAPVLT